MKDETEPKVKQEEEEKKQVCVTKTLFLGKIRCTTKQHTVKTLVPKLSVHKVRFINPSARC